MWVLVTEGQYQSILDVGRKTPASLQVCSLYLVDNLQVGRRRFLTENEAEEGVCILAAWIGVGCTLIGAWVIAKYS